MCKLSTDKPSLPDVALQKDPQICNFIKKPGLYSRNIYNLRPFQTSASILYEFRKRPRDFNLTNFGQNNQYEFELQKFVNSYLVSTHLVITKKKQ